MTAIVIPAVCLKPEQMTLMDDLLESIRDNFHLSMETVVCHDATPEAFRDMINDKYPWVTNLYHEGNRRNFCANSNMGLRYAVEKGHEGVILCNMDTVLPPLNYLSDLKGEGLVFAETSENHVVDYVKPVDKWAAEDPVALKGFCYYINANVIKEIGYLWEAIEASFDDDDYIARALLAGFPVEQSALRVWHKGSHIDQSVTGVSMTGSYTVADLGLKLTKFLLRWQLPFNTPHHECLKLILEKYKWSEVKESLFEP